MLLQRRLRRQSRRRCSLGHRTEQAGLAVGTLALVLLALTFITLAWSYSDLTANLPPISKLPTMLNAEDGLYLEPTRFYDRTGQHLLFTLQDPGAERRYLVFDPQKPDHLSPFLIKVTIDIEEPNFWNSPGFSLTRLTDPEPVTIAERLVDRLLLDQEPAGLRRALRMRLLAAQITSRYGRAQVLEWHLNSAYYGRLAYGAESAARLYLEKSASVLNLVESALLVAAEQAPALNPADTPEAAIERTDAILTRLLADGKIPQEEYDQANISALKLNVLTSAKPGIAPAFTNLALDQLVRRFGRFRIELGGLHVITSLDIHQQEQLACGLEAHLNRLEGRAASSNTSSGQSCETSQLLPAMPTSFQPLPSSMEGSAVVLDTATGQVLALAGDTTRTEESAILSGHQPGTLLTPFLAISAFARGFGPASLMWDIPGQLVPELEAAANPDGNFVGPLRLREALVSDNLVPLQQLLNEIGPDTAWKQAETLGLRGLSGLPRADHLLIEGGSVNLVDMAQAYSTIANQGILIGRKDKTGRIESSLLLKVSDNQGRILLEDAAADSQPVLTSSLAYLVHHVLSDEPSRWPYLGYPNPLEIGRPAGAKIGFAASGRQAWTAGYTPQRLVITWLGLPDEASQKVAPRFAADLWHALIQNASRNLPADGWKIPMGVSKMDVCSPSGLLPTRACPTVVSEIFLAGNEPTGPDTLYKTFQVNRETGYLATVFTPPELVEERTYLVLPEEAQSWGLLAGLPIPPQGYDRIQSPTILPFTQISEPAQFSVVHGQLIIRGTAAGNGFVYYQLQNGEGLNPSAWLPIGDAQRTPVQNGVLGIWDTSGLNGLFALRLQVVRKDQLLETAILQITVDNTPPRLRILYPGEGQRLPISNQPITLQTDTSDTVGLQKVEFYIDGLIIGSQTSSPYSLAWQPLNGHHTLKIIAYDLAGNTAESSIQFTIE